MPRRRPATAVVVIGRRQRPTADEREIARRLKAGEVYEVFLCVDCGREHLEPEHCGCWEVLF
jgi:hypothetical protein